MASPKEPVVALELNRALWNTLSTILARDGTSRAISHELDGVLARVRDKVAAKRTSLLMVRQEGTNVAAVSVEFGEYEWQVVQTALETANRELGTPLDSISKMLQTVVQARERLAVKRRKMAAVTERSRSRSRNRKD